MATSARAEEIRASFSDCGSGGARRRGESFGQPRSREKKTESRKRRFARGRDSATPRRNNPRSAVHARHTRAKCPVRLADRAVARAGNARGARARSFALRRRARVGERVALGVACTYDEVRNGGGVVTHGGELVTDERVAVVERLAHGTEDGLVQDHHEEQELGGDDGQGEVEVENLTGLASHGGHRDERVGHRGDDGGLHRLGELHLAARRENTRDAGCGKTRSATAREARGEARAARGRREPRSSEAGSNDTRIRCTVHGDFRDARASCAPGAALSAPPCARAERKSGQRRGVASISPDAPELGHGGDGGGAGAHGLARGRDLGAREEAALDSRDSRHRCWRLRVRV